jgi:predicted phosphohydrolase
MKLAWCTDTHFDIYDESLNVPLRMGAALREAGNDGIVISGDISQSHLLKEHLSALTTGFGSNNVYYVLGNHDVWGSDSGEFRKNIIPNGYPGRYLSEQDPIKLTSDTYITGFDGWYDARYGDYTRTQFLMNDWYRIGEICGDFIAGNGSRESVIPICRRIADKLASSVPGRIAKIAKTAKRVIIATHIPPFVQNSNHRGNPSDAGSLPWYSSKASGDMLLDVFRKYPSIEFTVVCGHSHSHAKYSPTKNSEVITGFAEYRRASVAGTLELLHVRKLQSIFSHGRSCCQWVCRYCSQSGSPSQRAVQEVLW